MEIRIAKEIGYGYGVRDAVDMAIDESEKFHGEEVCTFKVLQTICGVAITRQKRVDIREKCGRTIHIQDPSEIDPIDFTGVHTVGIGTGTSTPCFLVDELVGRLKAKATFAA